MQNLTVVFDLDGTLVDTAPDLVAATNHALATIGRPPVADALLLPMVSHGALAMIRSALGTDAGALPEADLYPLFDHFIAYYQANIAVHSRPFPGAVAALDRFAARGCRLAVCTNKREGLARSLLDELGLSSRFAAIAGRDTFPVCKPDPEHLFGTIRLAGGDPRHAIMIGDSSVDIATAKAAGIPIVAVTFGYTATPVAELDPDAMIDHFDELSAAISRVRPKS